MHHEHDRFAQRGRLADGLASLQTSIHATHATLAGTVSSGAMVNTLSTIVALACLASSDAYQIPRRSFLGVASTAGGDGHHDITQVHLTSSTIGIFDPI